MFIANTLFRTAQLWPDAPSLQRPGGWFSWAETLDRVRRIAGVLAAANARRVGVLAMLSHHYAEMSFAVPMAGGTLVPLNPRLAPAEMAMLLRQAEVDTLIVDQPNLDGLAALRGLFDCPIIYTGDAATSPAGAIVLEDRLTATPPADPVEVDPGHLWAVIFTGGTTGLPKGVQLSHRAATLNLQNILHDLRWGERPRFLQISPMFHMAGLGTTYAVAAMGGQIGFLPKFTVPDVLATLAAQRCTAINLVPTMMAMILAHPDLDRHDLSALEHVSYGASAIAEPTLRALLTRFPGLRLTQVYGQTEAGSHLTTLAAADHVLAEPLSNRLRAAGRAAPGVCVAILDDAGQPVARGAWGEICARSDSVFSGYLAHPVLTQEALRDGWLHTGDVGYLDDDGYLFVTDRLKDMVVSGGENISSREVEDVIAAHPDVGAVAVTAAPDPIWGERVHAHVVPRPGASLDGDALIAFCRDRMTGFKVPKQVTIRAEPLPLSAIGKVRKDVLRAQTPGS